MPLDEREDIVSWAANAAIAAKAIPVVAQAIPNTHDPATGNPVAISMMAVNTPMSSIVATVRASAAARAA